LSIIEENKYRTDKKLKILLGNIFGECYSIAFGDGLVILKPQPDFISICYSLYHTSNTNGL